MARPARSGWLAILAMAGAVSIVVAQQPIDLAGTWQSNIGLTYTITQVGLQWTWQDNTGARGAITFTPTGLATTWSDAGGQHSASGTIAERDPQGRPTKISWSNGVVFMRGTPSPPPAPTPAPAGPTTPLDKVVGLLGGAVPAGMAGVKAPDLAGTWASNIGLTYTMTGTGDEFQWQDSTGGRAAGRVVASGVRASWSDAAGVHSAAGVIAQRDSAGRPTRIVWSNGVVFTRTSPGQASTAPSGSPSPTPPAVAPPAAAPVPSQANLEGSWSSNIGERYGIRHAGQSILWRSTSGIQGTITFIPNGLMTTWSDASGTHSATGTITARDATGRPTRIEWSHGVIFERQAGGDAPGAPPASGEVTPRSVGRGVR